MSGYIGSKTSVTLVDGYTQAEADAEFVAKAGGTMTGGLTVGGTVTATDFAGDGSSLTGISTTPTTAEVGSATAGLAVGSVGSYAYLQHVTANLKFDAGITYAGSSLRYSGTLSRSGNTSNGHYMFTGTTAAGGTWRAMGAAQDYFSTKYPATLFLRIS